MKTVQDVADWIYLILNVTAVTGSISGETIALWRFKAPLNLEEKHIVIAPLPISWAPDVQEGFVNINCFAKDLDGGLPDETSMRAITAAVIARLEEYGNTTGTYFYYDLENQAIFADQDHPGMSYSNLRIRVYYQT